LITNPVCDKAITEILRSFNEKGTFDYDGGNAKTACNAPTDEVGICIFYDASKETKGIIYIEYCGHIQNDGSLATRKSGSGGLPDKRGLRKPILKIIN